MIFHLYLFVFLPSFLDPVQGDEPKQPKNKRRNNIPMLSGSVAVGSLYDGKLDQPLYGYYLWKNVSTKSYDVPHAHMDYIVDENVLGYSQNKFWPPSIITFNSFGSYH